MWCRPSSPDFAGGMGSPFSSVPKYALFAIASITMVSHGFRFKFFKISAIFLMLPGLGDQPLAVRSTTSDPIVSAV
jgi:hypothetical protein